MNIKIKNFYTTHFIESNINSSALETVRVFDSDNKPALSRHDESYSWKTERVTFYEERRRERRAYYNSLGAFLGVSLVLVTSVAN